ncbi:MAG TPA: ABC transporter permease [Candidatus Acidoferrum sp.]|nr:ABC transporter permease [Candidatus Acidoferrum sp.]
MTSPASYEKSGKHAPKFSTAVMKLRISESLQPGVVTLLVLFFCIYAGYRSGDFWSVLNWQLLTQPLAEAGLVSLGMMFVIACGGIDLSVGAIIGVAAVTAGITAQHKLPVSEIEIAALAAGMLCGAFNGLLIGILRLSSILVTLGSMILFSGVALALSNGNSFAGFPDGLLWWTDATLLGIPVEFLLFLAVAAISAVLLRYTLWGHYVIAVGSNRVAARYSGYPVALALFGVYTLQGLLCGMTGILLVARLASARADMGQGLMLMAIAAVVLGGAPIAGGSASVIGTLVGVAAFYVVQDGLLLLDVPPFVQHALTSVLLLVAVAAGILLRGNREDRR